MERPSGFSVGRSLALWTAMSAEPRPFLFFVAGCFDFDDFEFRARHALPEVGGDHFGLLEGERAAARCEAYFFCVGIGHTEVGKIRD